jgi:hypothetical protein
MGKSKLSILEIILASKPIRTGLEFGINNNVRLTALSNETRKREGEIINRNTWMTFTKFNDKGDAIAKSEFNYFNLDHTTDYAPGNYGTQLAHAINLIQILNPEALETFEADLEEEIGDESGLEAAFQSKKGCKKLTEGLYTVLEAALKGKIGDESPLMRLKVVTDRKTGKYNQLSDDSVIVEPMDQEDTVLVITNYEKSNKAKALLTPTAKADSAGASPADKKSTKAGSILNI